MKQLKRILTFFFLLAALALVAFTVLRALGVLLFWNEADPDVYEVFGVDVSAYQGNVDWPDLKKQGVDFAFIKATEGSGMHDRQFAANWKGAQEAGVMPGAYHFFSYDSSGVTQADNFIATVPLTVGALPPVVDLEFYGCYLQEPRSAEETTPILKALLERLEAQYGQRPIIYTTERAYRLYIKDTFEEYPLWMSLPMIGPFWHDWSFWQYSHHARLTGYQGTEAYIDLNVFRGSATALAALGYGA